MLAFTFPGQGSQRPGMGRPWLDHESWELVGEASEVADRDVARLLLDADANELKDTRNAQLTTFVLSLVVLDAVERLGLEPTHCAGHSLGEYTALIATGALGFTDGVRLVSERAEAMHDAGLENPGTMAAVLGLDDEQVEVACRLADSDVWVANFNAPGQIVIAGTKAGIERAIEVAKKRGVRRALPLPVSAPFHCELMKPAEEKLQPILDAANFKDLWVSLVSNVDASPIGTAHAVRNALLRQVVSSVRWVESVQKMVSMGVKRFVEIGPGTVLTGLIKRIDANAELINISDAASLENFLNAH